MLRLLKLALIPDQSLMLFILAFKHHSSACDIFVRIFGFLLAQLAQLDAIMIVLFAVLFSLLGEVEEHRVVHVDVFHLCFEVGENFPILLNDLLVGSHFFLDAVIVARQFGAISVESGEAIAQLLCVHHGDLVVHENALNVSKLTLHLLHFRGNENLSSFDHIIIVRLLLCHL